MDCFGDKRDLVEDIEEEVKALPHIEIIDLKTKIIRWEETNIQLANEVVHL